MLHHKLTDSGILLSLRWMDGWMDEWPLIPRGKFNEYSSKTCIVVVARFLQRWQNQVRYNLAFSDNLWIFCVCELWHLYNQSRQVYYTWFNNNQKLCFIVLSFRWLQWHSEWLINLQGCEICIVLLITKTSAFHCERLKCFIQMWQLGKNTCLPYFFNSIRWRWYNYFNSSAFTLLILIPFA